MAIFYDIERLPVFEKAVLTIGTFDGVHTGHRAILREVVEHTKSVGGESVLVTFDPHPRTILFPDQKMGVITPLGEKLKLITEAGIQHIVIVPFTLGFAEMSAGDYIADFLVRIFQPHSIIIGYDHRFGHDRSGGIDMLRQYAPDYKYEVVEIPAQLIKDAAVSSTKIRNAIKTGNIDEANMMLGRQYSFTGTVTHGNKLGRTLGYPTANLQLAEANQVLPGNGIYAVNVAHHGLMYGGMMSIGFNPTVTDTKDLKIEVNIFDFNKEIYGDSIEVFFINKLRNELKFKSLEGLIDQLHLDKENSIKIRIIANDN